MLNRSIRFALAVLFIGLLHATPAGAVAGALDNHPVSSRPAITCSEGAPVGPQYPNRFYHGYDDGHGGCATYTTARSFDALDVTMNPTYIEGDITINAQGTVTIEPGVTLIFSNVGIYAKGTLNVRGSAAASVTMISAQATKAAGDWRGIAFQPGSSGTFIYPMPAASTAPLATTTQRAFWWRAQRRRSATASSTTATAMMWR